MRKEGIWWIDGNNNRWSNVTQAEAERLSKTLINCSGCSRCSNCSDFKQNPNRYTGQRIGSRDSQTTTYWSGDKIQVVCGCYKGTLDGFEARVKEVHGDNAHGKNYRQYIAIVRKIIEMEVDG
jgi:hypothetical protein